MEDYEFDLAQSLVDDGIVQKHLLHQFFNPSLYDFRDRTGSNAVKKNQLKIYVTIEDKVYPPITFDTDENAVLFNNFLIYFFLAYKNTITGYVIMPSSGYGEDTHKMFSIFEEQSRAIFSNFPAPAQDILLIAQQFLIKEKEKAKQTSKKPQCKYT